MQRTSLFSRIAFLATTLLIGEGLCTHAVAQVGQAVPPAGQAQPQQQGVPQAPWQLTIEQQERVDQILNYWEHSTGQIETFKCDFIRWDYNATFAPVADQPTSVSEGEIRFASPDKGMIHADQIRFAQIVGEQLQYLARENEFGDHWVCDGRSVYEYRHRQQLLVETILPPEMHGSAISNGPLPFLFGVSRDEMVARYWVRELDPPEGAVDQFWLQVVPKTQADAANFVQAEIILDSNDFLPEALVLHLPGGTERKVFEFSDRASNGVLAGFMNDFLGGFVEPALPRGWRKVVENGSAIP